MDIDKARALNLAVTFVGGAWESLTEEDFTVNILRYLKLLYLSRRS